MSLAKKKTTVPYPSVGADEEQSLKKFTKLSIATEPTENKSPEPSFNELFRKMQRIYDPAYLPTVSMQDLYETVYPSRPPVIDGLLYAGTYLFVGAPKVGKSFLMAQIGYHVSTGLDLWDYPVHQGAVLYLALEDDHRRLQDRLFRMFGTESADNLYSSIYAKQLGAGLEEQLKWFVQEHPDTRLIIIDTLQKERRTSNAATLDISGRDQQDQRLYLTRNEERLIWTLERTETELWKEPPDPVLTAIAALVTAEQPQWSGTATELVAALGLEMKPNALSMRLNVRAGKLQCEYGIRYESHRSHAGRTLSFTLDCPQA